MGRRGRENGTVSGAGYKVDVIPAKKHLTPARRNLHEASDMRVAAYCRVSTGDESQQTSYTKQKAFYTELIQKRAGWKLAGIYADEARSGTSRAHREQFNHMMEDALKGKIDYIITKSISRFARNTVDTLDCVRQLQRLSPPVGIYFEKENIDTLHSGSELFLTLYSSIAQEESRSISENIRWSLQKNFREGRCLINLDRMLGYDRSETGEWRIVEEQAAVVRYIFEQFAKGESGRAIATQLNEMGKTTVSGRSWRTDAIYYVLRNEKYVGDAAMQKTITESYLTHKSIPNKGQVPRYYVTDHHEPIIDRITWNKVQAILNGTGQEEPAGEEEPVKKRGRRRSPFARLRCKTCGSSLRRMTYNVAALGYTDGRRLAEGERDGYRETYTFSDPVWKCGCKDTSENSPKNCDRGKILRELSMEQSFMELMYRLKREYKKLGGGSELGKRFSQLYESEKKKELTYGFAPDPAVQAESAAALLKKRFEEFTEGLRGLPEKNRAGEKLKIWGLDEGSCDVLEFDTGFFNAFITAAEAGEDKIVYRTSFGLEFETFGNSRTPEAFLGFRMCEKNGEMKVVTTNYQMRKGSIQYHRKQTAKQKKTDKDDRS